MLCTLRGGTVSVSKSNAKNPVPETHRPAIIYRLRKHFNPEALILSDDDLWACTRNTCVFSRIRIQVAWMFLVKSIKEALKWT